MNRLIFKTKYIVCLSVAVVILTMLFLLGDFREGVSEMDVIKDMFVVNSGMLFCAVVYIILVGLSVYAAEFNRSVLHSATKIALYVYSVVCGYVAVETVKNAAMKLTLVESKAFSIMATFVLFCIIVISMFYAVASWDRLGAIE